MISSSGKYRKKYPNVAWRSAQSLYACMHVINASVDHAWLLFNSNVTAPVHQTIVLCETCNLAQGVLSICPGHLHLVCMWIINEDHTASCLYDTGRNMRNIGNGRGKICLMQDAIVLHCNTTSFMYDEATKKKHSLCALKSKFSRRHVKAISSHCGLKSKFSRRRVEAIQTF